jgi:hypothetical protein
VIWYKKNLWRGGTNFNKGRRIASVIFVRSVIVSVMTLGFVNESLLSKSVFAQDEPAAHQTTMFLPALSISTADALQLSQVDGEPADDGLPVDDNPPTETIPIAESGTGWKADMETADLSQWSLDKAWSKAEFDSGFCTRPTDGVSTEQARSGQYSIKMIINSTLESGCRQFRKPEAASGNAYYYSAWFYIPRQTHIGNFWNIMQFKSNLNNTSGLFWKLDVRNTSTGKMQVMLVWKGPIAGPTATDGNAVKKYTQTVAELPVGKWFQLQIYLKQSEQFDGQITVWQDGVQLFDVQNVRTKYPGGYQNWSVNNYGKDLYPNPATLYIDDAAISAERITQGLTLNR